MVNWQAEDADASGISNIFPFTADSLVAQISHVCALSTHAWCGLVFITFSSLSS